MRALWDLLYKNNNPILEDSDLMTCHLSKAPPIDIITNTPITPWDYVLTYELRGGGDKYSGHSGSI